MPSPFPGMDPYLERQDLWPDFHNRFAGEISVQLNRSMPPGYFAKTECRFELDIVFEDEDAPRRQQKVADVGMTHESEGGVAVAIETRREISPAIKVRVALEPARIPFVEIYESSGRQLVTVIEILSPANKLPGRNRDAYRDKQDKVLRTYANLVEIDLLRDGEHVLPNSTLEHEIAHIQPPPTYLVLVSEAAWRDEKSLGYSIYPFGLRDPLPCVGIPLKPMEPSVPLDLQYVFNRVYDTGPYRRGAVRYTEPLSPPLSVDDAAWTQGLLKLGS
jgi:hypothetical protein